MKWSRIGSAAVLAFALTACEGLDDLTDLDVTNENAPDRERALAEAGDIESLIASSFQIWWGGWNGSYQSFGCPGGALNTAADEVSMSWGNFGMQQLSSEPRVAWPNSPSWRYRCHVEAPWYRMYRAISAVYDGLVAIENNPDLAVAFDVDRAKAFGKFMQGISHGVLAVFFDSAFVLDESVDLEEDVLALQAYPAVWAAAKQMLLDAATQASGIDPLNPTWINGNAVTGTQLAQLAHSFIQRFEPQLARTPAERAAVNWAGIIGHVDQGVTADFFVEADDNLWWSAPLWWSFQPTSTTWGRADYKTIGPADTTGAYQAWLAASLANRGDVLMAGSDRRITPPSGDPRGKGLDFQFHGTSRFPALRGTYHFSMYVATRYRAHSTTGTAFLSPMPLFQKVELDLTKAEALIRTNDLLGAVTLINQTRVTRGELPPATVADADLMDKMIYEKRLENFGACIGCAYFDRRGWGPLAATGPAHHNGLVEGTPLHFAPPGKELEVLQLPVYTYGGVGNEGTSLSVAPVLSASAGGTAVPAKWVYAFGNLNSLQEKLRFIQAENGTPFAEGVKSLTRH